MKKYARLITLAMVMVCCLNGLWASGSEETVEKKELSILTWNIGFYEENIMGWIADFEAKHPDVEVHWLDKKGTEFDTFVMTQLAAGDLPDLIDIQGPLFAKYAEMGALKDLSSYLNNDPEVEGRYNQDVIDLVFKYQEGTYMIPFYFAPSVLYYNKLLFEEAGITAPPTTVAELVNYAKRMTKDEKSGFLTINFDWMYWPLFKANGVDLLTPDNKKAAFNTPAGVETLETLAEMTQSGAIAKISWTTRWKEPNDAFGAGIIGMYNSNGSAYHNFATSGAEWVSPETVGVAPFPGRWNVPGQHGWAMSASTKYPDEAWELMKIITNAKWSKVFIERTNIFTGNTVVDEWFLNQPQVLEDEIKSSILQTQLANLDKLTGSPSISENERVKDAFFSNIQKALLGEISAAEALNLAEEAVNRILAE